jgi:TPR repeat protein
MAVDVAEWYVLDADWRQATVFFRVFSAGLIELLCLVLFTAGSFGQKNTAPATSQLSSLIEKAEHGDSKAQFELGGRYERGISVKQNIERAFEWYRKAADEGLPQAQFRLGSSYEYGFNGRSGFKPNAAEAIRWYRKAADQNYVQAEIKLGNIYAYGIQGSVDRKDAAEALRWFLKAADQGDNEALYELGVGYDYGAFGARDAAEAFRWYRKAAEQGSKSAASTIGLKYFEGSGGIKQDFAEAARWYGCPKPSDEILAACTQMNIAELPQGVVNLMGKMKCDSNEALSAVDLTGEGTPVYEVCCSQPAHGPCGAVLIGKIGEEWKELSPKGGLLGFTGPCGSFVVLDSQHNGFHDVCLPDECSTPIKNNVCEGPAVWQFTHGRYRSVPNTPTKPAL